MTGLRTVLGVVVLSIAATITQAQEQSINIPPPVLTIDQDRLLSETRLGERLNTELEAQAAILAEENARIEGGFMDDLLQPLLMGIHDSVQKKES